MELFNTYKAMVDSADNNLMIFFLFFLENRVLNPIF